MLTIAPPLPRAAMRGTASDAQRKKPLRCAATTADQSAKEILPTRPTRWMPALLTRMSIRPACPSIALKASATRAGSVTSASRYAGARLGGGDLVEGEEARAVGEQPLGDRIADAARGAGHDCAPSKELAMRPRLSASAQYISQPPLTLIVAPVT